MSYRYTPLPDPDLDIRLLQLQPGRFDDPIEITLRPARLPERATTQATQKLTLKELRKTLPKDKWVEKTREGRFFFYGEELGTSWHHPDPSFPRELYNSPEATGTQWLGSKFEALSYAWGSLDELAVEISVSNASSTSSDPATGTLAIRRSLHEALQHLRYADDVRILWVDALCINQEDETEKSKQIRFMKRIYEIANRVVIWLGPSSDDSDLACSTLSCLGSQMPLASDQSIWLHPEASESNWHRHEFDPFDSPTHKAIDTLLRRSWFERLWVWQEAVLADSRAVIHCGAYQLSWVLFRTAIRRLSLPEMGFSPFQWQAEFVSQLTGYTQASPFYNLTIGTTLRLCSEPRDRVYALLGIARPEYSQAISVDYSLPVADVYKNALVAYVEVFNNLALLTHCSPLNRNYDLPSWVPDWTSKSNRPSQLGTRFASAQSAAHATFVRPHTLVVHGLSCATITSVGATCGWGNGTDMKRNIIELVDPIRSWLPKDVGHGKYVTGETKVQAYTSTLIGGNMANFCDNNTLSYENAHAGFWDILSPSPNAEDVEFTLGNPFMAELFVSCRGCCFFETNEGYFGRGYHGIEPGDKVCIVLGLSLPVVLRHLPDGTYKVIGVVYVHGLDHSEGLLGPVPQPWEWNLDWAPDNLTWLPLFRHTTTGVLTAEDPRLGELPPGWRKMRSWDPEERQSPIFRNAETDEETGYDPRLHPERLKKRGVRIQEFRLV